MLKCRPGHGDSNSMTAALWVIAPDATPLSPAHDVIEASHSSVSGYITIFVIKSTVGDRTHPHGGSVTALGSSWKMLESVV